jgi:hypothetical protein
LPDHDILCAKEIDVMDERINVSLERVRDCIQKLGGNEFTTADVIRKYSGRFCSNIGTPATYSFNAQFGALLKRNEAKLGIVEIAGNEPVKDDHGHDTTTSRWRIST